MVMVVVVEMIGGSGSGNVSGDGSASDNGSVGNIMRMRKVW